MKKRIYTLIVGCTALVTLSACGGGGGGGGAGKTTTKLYVFGNLSTNYSLATVTSAVTVPNFVDYSSSSSDVNNTSQLRSGVIRASGQVLASSATGSYNKTTKLLTITVTNGSFNTISINGTTGTEIATLLTTAGTTLPTSDLAPYAGQFNSSPSWVTGDLNGCSVTYGP